MPIREYRNFEVILLQERGDSDDRDEVSVQVFRSPVGEAGPIRVPLPSGLSRLLARLERRALSVKEIITLGETLANLLFPDEIGRLFERSLDRLDAEQGLRLRLRLDPGLVNVPWEYVYRARGRGEKDATGFLVLDPRLSLVRHEALDVSGDLDDTPRERRLIVALASPQSPGYDLLDLDRERDDLIQALEGVAGLAPVYLEHVTATRLGDELLGGADIFHFAGHGEFTATGLGVGIGTLEGEGAIILEDEQGGAAPMPAEQLAINLRGQGVQLVVLGACQTGRRDGQNVWSGVVAALMRAGVPAAVAMQYKIWDKAAIAFSRSFYRGLTAGLLLDQAVAAGRLAAFNVCHPLREDPQLASFWRDWGVPVLYYRADQDFRLPAIAGVDQRRLVPEGPILESEKAIISEDTEPAEGRASDHFSGKELSGLATLDEVEGELVEIARQIRRNRLVYFVGPDLPMNLTGVPAQQELADLLAVRQGLEPGMRFAAVAQQVMSHGNRWEFTQFLRETLETTDLRPGPFYRSLARLIQATRPELIITTAYHRMLEWALRDVGELTFNNVTRDDTLHFADPDRPTLLKLYGDIDQVDTLVVTEQDQNSLLRGRKNPEMVEEVRRAFRRNSVLFIGYDLSDPAVGNLFDEVTGDRFQLTSYAVWEGLTPTQAESLRSNRSLVVLPVDPLACTEALMERVGRED